MSCKGVHSQFWRSGCRHLWGGRYSVYHSWYCWSWVNFPGTQRIILIEVSNLILRFETFSWITGVWCFFFFWWSCSITQLTFWGVLIRMLELLYQVLIYQFLANPFIFFFISLLFYFFSFHLLFPWSYYVFALFSRVPSGLVFIFECFFSFLFNSLWGLFYSLFFIFGNSFRWTEKLKDRYREFPYAPHPTTQFLLLLASCISVVYLWN